MGVRFQTLPTLVWCRFAIMNTDYAKQLEMLNYMLKGRDISFSIMNKYSTLYMIYDV